MSNNKKASDTSSLQLLKGSTLVFGLNAISKIFTTGLKSIISHLLGPVGLGVYELVLALTRFLSMIPQFGMHQTIVQFISVYRTKEAWSQIQAAVRFGLLIIFLFSLSISTGLFFGQDIFKNIFFESDVNDIAIGITIIIIPFFSIKNFLGFSLRGLRRYAQEIFFNKTLYPFLIITILSIVYFFPKDITIEFVLIATLCSIIVSSIGAFFAIENHFRFKEIVKEKFKEKVRFFKYSFPIWITTVLSTSYSQLDRIFLGLFSTVPQIGIYAASYTLALLVSFVMSSFNPLFQPLIAEAYAENDLAKIRELYQKVVNWTSYLIFPFLGGIILFGESILIFVFGATFDKAYPVLLVLTTAECVNALAGPSGNILLMAERQKESAWILGIGFFVGICLNLILIPYFDALGAAIGTGIGLIIINYLRVYAVGKHYKIVLSYRKPILSALIVLFAIALTYSLGMYLQSIYVNVLFYISIIAFIYSLSLDIRQIFSQIFQKVK